MAATRGFCAAVLGMAVAVAALTGCGGDKDAGGAPIVVPAATTAQTGPFAGESADQIFSKAEVAMDTLTAVTVDAHLTDDGSAVHVAAALTDTGKCAASIQTDDSDPAQIIGIHDTYYLKGDASFWADQGSHGDELAQALGGKWVKLPAGQSSDLDDFCELAVLISGTEDGDTVTAKGEPTTHLGQPAVPLQERDDDGTDNVMYVASEGAPYILGLVDTDSGDSISFTGFDKAPKISAPPSRDIVDLSSVDGDTPNLSI